MRKLVALFIMICVFFPLAVTVLSLVSIRPWVLDRSFYERLVSDERIYEAAFIGEVPVRFNRTVFNDVNQIPPEALHVALRTVVTPEYMREQAVSTVNQFFDFIEGRSTNAEITLDISFLKAAIAGEHRVQFANALAGALPPCAVGQEPIAPNGRLVRCIAPDTLVNEAAEQVAGALPAAVENTPDHIVINDPVAFGQSWRSMDWFVGTAVRFGLNASIVTMLLLLIVVGLVGAYLGGDDKREQLQWFGTALLVPSVLFMLMGLALTLPWVAEAMYNVNWGGVDYSEAFQQAMISLAAYVTKQMGGGFLLSGTVSSVIALWLLIWSWNMTPSQQRTGKVVHIPA
jgi:hypothetical protein